MPCREHTDSAGKAVAASSRGKHLPSEAEVLPEHSLLKTSPLPDALCLPSSPKSDPSNSFSLRTGSAHLWNIVPSLSRFWRTYSQPSGCRFVPQPDLQAAQSSYIHSAPHCMLQTSADSAAQHPLQVASSSFSHWESLDTRKRELNE